MEGKADRTPQIVTSTDVPTNDLFELVEPDLIAGNDPASGLRSWLRCNEVATRGTSDLTGVAFRASGNIISACVRPRSLESK